MLDIVREAINIARQKRKEQAHKLAKSRAAKEFNDIYTYRKQYVKECGFLAGTSYGPPIKKGNAWMCPECNQIKLSNKSSVFSGIQYPACCSTPDGDRLERGIKYKD
jgi:hypothetical protein